MIHLQSTEKQKATEKFLPLLSCMSLSMSTTSVLYPLLKNLNMSTFGFLLTYGIITLISIFIIWILYTDKISRYPFIKQFDSVTYERYIIANFIMIIIMSCFNIIWEKANLSTSGIVTCLILLFITYCVSLVCFRYGYLVYDDNSIGPINLNLKQLDHECEYKISQCWSRRVMCMMLIALFTILLVVLLLIKMQDFILILFIGCIFTLIIILIIIYTKAQTKLVVGLCYFAILVVIIALILIIFYIDKIIEKILDPLNKYKLVVIILIAGILLILVLLLVLLTIQHKIKHRNAFNLNFNKNKIANGKEKKEDGTAGL